MHDKLQNVSTMEKMVDKELSQMRSMMEMNSSRLNPDFAEFNESQEILRIGRSSEKSLIQESIKPKSVVVEN